MTDLLMVQGDTAPDLVAVLHERDNPSNKLDLTSAAHVYLLMRKPDDRRFTVNAEVTIEDAINGVVRYEWADNDLSVIGTYQCRFRVIWLDTKVESTPDTFSIEIDRT